MITGQYINTGNIPVMSILNYNRIRDEKKREAIKAMGMSACQDWPTSERSSLDKKNGWEGLQK